MKIHRPTYFGIIEALAFTFNDGHYADKVIERSFRKNKKWGAKDRRIIAETVYGMVRWWRKLCYCLNIKELGPYDETQLERLFQLWLIVNEIEPPLYLEQRLNWAKLKDIWHADHTVAIDQSVPGWIYEEGLSQMKQKDWAQILKAMNERAEIYLRVNTLKTTPEELKKALKAEGIETSLVKNAKEALVLIERKNVFISECYKKGMFEVQDGGSQKIAPMFEIKKGMRVIDACAGAGGKSLHLAALMKNKGKIISLDIHDWKLKELKLRARRAGVDIIESRSIDSKVIKRLKNSADALLLDVPCSGIGVLKRSPDTKWKLTKQKLESYKETQYEILEKYSEMLKPGGQLVYATCSVWPEENEKQIEKFMKAHPDQWQIEKELKIWPSERPFDGFYAVRLRLRSDLTTA